MLFNFLFPNNKTFPTMISIVTISLLILEATHALTPVKLAPGIRIGPPLINPPQLKALVVRKNGSARPRGGLLLSSNDGLLDKFELAPSGKGRNDNSTDSATVSAVLAASEEAVAAAEASMLPQDLMEQVDFVASLGSNRSITVSPTATDTSLVEEAPEILPASPVVVDEPVTAIIKIEAPSVSKIIKFAIPAIGVWLCNPLLSLIDTSAVGILCGTTQQAALSPAVAVTDYAALLIVSINSVSSCK
jgi:hypothetical protein